MGLFDRLRLTKTEQQPITVKSLPQILASRLSGRVQPIWSEWDENTARVEGFNGNTWVFACISKRTRAAKSVPLLAGRWVEGENGKEFQHEPESPLQKLIDRPNPDHDGASFIERIIQHLDTGGNAYIHKIRAGREGGPAELWPLQPEEVGITRGETQLVDMYHHGRYKGGSMFRLKIEPSDLIHMRYENPEDPVFGLPPMKPAGKAIDTDNEATTWQKVSFQNRGVSDMLFKLPEGTTQEELDAFRDSYNAAQTGTGNARKAMFATAEAYPLDRPSAELDYVNSRAALRVEICSAFDVPPPMVGIYDDATLANIQTARRIFWLEGMIPLLDLILGKLNHGLAKEFGDQWAIKADLSSVEALKEDRTTDIENLERLWRMGVPLNQGAQFLELNLEEIPGGDIGYLPASVLPVGFDFDSDEGETDIPATGDPPQQGEDE